MQNDLRVRSLGEKGLLKRLHRFCPAHIVGDDAAVLDAAVGAGMSLVVTTDVLVENVHFSDRTTSAEDAGWRAVAANLSDLAAMGATPLGITVGLSLPGDTSVAWVEEVYRGMAACLAPFQTPIVGGDVTRSPTIALAITAFGQVNPRLAIRRAIARPGDAIAVTGYHGSSRAGLELLLAPETGQALTVEEKQDLLRAHQRPTPRLDVPALLYGTMGEAMRVAGMDSSDGLADAIEQICQMSDVGASIDLGRIPLRPALHRFVGGDRTSASDPSLPEPSEADRKNRALEWALYGGEDFELVLCLPLEPAKALVRALGKGAAIIGTITKEPKIHLEDSSQTYSLEAISGDRAFQHFQATKQ